MSKCISGGDTLKFIEREAQRAASTLGQYAEQEPLIEERIKDFRRASSGGFNLLREIRALFGLTVNFSANEATRGLDKIERAMIWNQMNAVRVASNDQEFYARKAQGVVALQTMRARARPVLLDKTGIVNILRKNGVTLDRIIRFLQPPRYSQVMQMEINETTEQAILELLRRNEKKPLRLAAG